MFVYSVHNFPTSRIAFTRVVQTVNVVFQCNLGVLNYIRYNMGSSDSKKAGECSGVNEEGSGSIGSKAMLSMPIIKGNKFDNPWDTWHATTAKDVFKMIFGSSYKDQSNIPSNSEELDVTLPIHKPDFELLSKPSASEIRYMWIGHATCLVQMDGVTILTDPIFSNRCAPVQFLGPKRYRRPACVVEELPEIDAVVISHTHYDHLDYGSVCSLHKRFGNKLRWFVPMGLKSWMQQRGCENVVELMWWDKGTVTNSAGQEVDFVFTPAQHWSNRSLTDGFKILWGSWSIIGPSKRFFFGGDTGYCPAFKEIGEKYGPFNCSAIPIGAIEPRWFMTPIHVNPEEAVLMHQDIKSIQSYGIHWGTFRLTREHYMEPKSLLLQCMEDKGLDPSTFCTVYHGDVLTVDN